MKFYFAVLYAARRLISSDVIIGSVIGRKCAPEIEFLSAKINKNITACSNIWSVYYELINIIFQIINTLLDRYQ